MPDNAAHEEIRERILRAATRAVVDVGVVDLRMEEVGRRAGVPTGEVLRHFHSRRRLVEAALRRNEEEMLRGCEAAVACRQTAGAKLRRYVDCYLPVANDDPTWALWLQGWALIVASRELDSWRHRLVARWRDDLAAIVTLGVTRGEFACTDPAAFAAAYVAILDGLAIHSLSDPPFLESTVARRLAVEYATARLCPGAGPLGDATDDPAASVRAAAAPGGLRPRQATP